METLVSPRLPLCLLCLHFGKVGSQVPKVADEQVLVLFSKGFQPSLLPVLLIGGPLVLGEHGLQHRAVQGALDAEGPGVKQVLWFQKKIRSIHQR